MTAVRFVENNAVVRFQFTSVRCTAIAVLGPDNDEAQKRTRAKLMRYLSHEQA